MRLSLPCSRELQNLPAIPEHLSVLSHSLINYSATFREHSCIIKKEFDRVYPKASDSCRKQKPIQVTKEKNRTNKNKNYL